ncbi:unnamed protein product [marine sediment metagenome]|uniref:Uncharacterized protein n=1 Tax=marine sediment metagenome TaxID=412755 RepID=X1LMC7_9ZZZZ
MTKITLKDGLTINAVLTGITGLGLALFAELAAEYLIPGAPVWLIAALGIALVLFAADVALIARWKAQSKPLVGFSMNMPSVSTSCAEPNAVSVVIQLVTASPRCSCTVITGGGLRSL